MSTTANDAQQIQAEMRRVREELRADVRDVVSNTQDLMAAARVLTQWQTYVKRYPWACIGAAAGLGFLIVPSRLRVMRPDAETLLQLAKQQKLVVEPTGAPPPKKGMLGSLLGMAAGTMLQVGMAVASKQLNQFLAAAATQQPHRREGAFHD